MDLDAKKLFLLNTHATVKEMEVTEESLRSAINLALVQAKAGKAEKAEVDPVGPNNQPRMLQVTAFLCHALDPENPEPNLNNRGFTKADLEEVVANGMFKAPFFGMIDWNHDFSLYGVWYHTELALDPQTNTWGILAHGALFAWRYTELADKVLAMQARQGHVDVSMSCMPGFYEPAKTKDGREFLIVRKPVFFTTSLLDVPPADQDARGVGSEDPASTNEQRAAELLKAHLDFEVQNSEEHLMDELMQKIEAALGEHKAILAPFAEAMARLPEIEAALEQAQADLKAANEAKDAATAEVEGLKAEKATLEVALEAAKTEVAALVAEVEPLRAMKAEADAAAEAAEKAAKREARMAEVSDAVKEALEAREDKDAIIEQWMAMDEAQWALTKASFEVASGKRKTLAERSEEEGALSSVASKGEGEYAINRWRTRK